MTRSPELLFTLPARRVFLVATRIGGVRDTKGEWQTRPNPPIAEEFWGIRVSQQRIDAEETPWEGMWVPSWWE